MLRSTDNPDGNKTTKAVNYASDAKKAMLRGSEQSRILQTGLGAERLAKDLAAAFNGMREQLGAYIALMRESDGKAKEFVRELAAVTHGDYGAIVPRPTGVPDTFNVEDAGLFAAKLVEIASTQDSAQRMRACVKLNSLVFKAIRSWQSKVDKMKERSVLTGATEAEVEVANAKIVQFNEAIATLRKRGSDVTALYYDAKRRVLGLVSDLDKRFRVINYQDPVGKDNPVPDLDSKAGQEPKTDDKPETKGEKKETKKGTEVKNG